MWDDCPTSFVRLQCLPTANCLKSSLSGSGKRQNHKEDYSSTFMWCNICTDVHMFIVTQLYTEMCSTPWWNQDGWIGDCKKNKRSVHIWLNMCVHVQIWNAGYFSLAWTCVAWISEQVLHYDKWCLLLWWRGLEIRGMYLLQSRGYKYHFQSVCFSFFFLSCSLKKDLQY